MPEEIILFRGPYFVHSCSRLLKDGQVGWCSGNFRFLLYLLIHEVPGSNLERLTCNLD
jgi:hypothetical protein